MEMAWSEILFIYVIGLQINGFGSNDINMVIKANNIVLV